MKNCHFKLNRAFLLGSIIVLSQVVGCGGTESPQRITLEEKNRRIPINQRVNKIYSRLEKAAEPLCKQESCHYPLDITFKDHNLNAFTDGKKIYITEGMLNFAAKEEETALILAHELAHSLMDHMGAKQKNALLGSVLDVALAVGGVDTGGLFSDVGGHTHSQAFESEADYIGLYIMARAGYSVNQVANFWRRMAIEDPASIRGSFMSTHPSSAERFLTIEKTAQEIHEKQQAHEPLLPEFIKK